MGLYVIGHWQQGASHVSHNKICQDAFAYQWIEKDRILAVSVADGHGSDKCLYSHEGSAVATERFCIFMHDLVNSYRGNLEELGAYLYKEGSVFVARRLVREWQEVIKARHQKYRRVVPDLENENEDIDHAIFHLYGTTLLGMLITPYFHFAFQLGDGDITRVVKGQTNAVLESDQMLGVETHSLCENEPWKHAHSTVIHVDEEKDEFAYIITTDGFKNSHASETDYLQSCREYIDTIKVYGLATVKVNLPGWLSETSKEGCGDDITVAIITSFDKESGPEKAEEPVQTEEAEKEETTAIIVVPEVLSEKEANEDQPITEEQATDEIAEPMGNDNIEPEGNKMIASASDDIQQSAECDYANANESEM